MKKKVIPKKGLILIILILIISTITGYFIYVKMVKEKALNDEITRINDVLKQKNIDEKKLNKYLNRTVSKDEYRIVEKAYKSYLKDNQKILNDISVFFKNNDSANLLTIKNIKDDGKEFTNSLKKLKEDKETLKNLQKKYKNQNTTKTINSYIEKKNINKYYKNYYKNKITANINVNTDKLNKTIDENLILLDKIEEVFNFLIKNKQSYQVDDKKIYFYNDNLKNEYTKLINDIKNE